MSTQKYDFSKLLNENLTGFEAELQKSFAEKFKYEPTRGHLVPMRAITFSTLADNAEDVGTAGAKWHSLKQSLNEIPLFRRLGCSVYEDLTGLMSVPNIGIDDAELKAEGEEAPLNTATTGGATLYPTRYSITKDWGMEYLSVSANFQYALKIMLQACERALSKQVLKLAGAASIVADRDHDDIAAAITWGDVLALYKGIEPFGELNAFALSQGLNAKLMNTEKVLGSGRFISEGSVGAGVSIAGTQAFPTPLTEYTTDLVFGNFSMAHVGLWRATEVIVDRFTKAATGKVAVTVNLLADAKIGSAGAFKSIRNGSIA